MNRSPVTGRTRRGASGFARRVVGRLLRPVLANSRQPGLEALGRAEEIDRSLLPLRIAVKQWHAEEDDFRAGEVNLELFKAEIHLLEETLAVLGQAIAPDGGLPKAADALAEIRWRITECERRLRALEAGGPGELVSGVNGPVVPPPPPAGSDGRYDRRGLERRFGAAPDESEAELAVRYRELLRPHSPVLVLGSGRGDVLAALEGDGVAAAGVDDDAAQVAEARLRGLDVANANPVEFLESQPLGSLGAIAAIGGLEHLPLDTVVHMLELSARRLRPGGLFLAQAANPTSLIVLGNSYPLDPTHLRPLHPKLLEFLCESAGFRDVEVRFYRPATAMQIGMLEDAEPHAWVGQVNDAFRRLNDVLFGPQEFAVIARTDDSPPPGQA